MSAITMARYQRQFDACCGRVAGKANPLTALERMALEATETQREASLMWSELAAIDETE